MRKQHPFKENRELGAKYARYLVDGSEIFGWAKITGGIAKVKVRGLARVRTVFTFAIATYNLIRIPKLIAVTE